MKHLLFISICIFAFFTATSQNSLTISDPHATWKPRTQGIITEPTIDITPAGAYAQVEFTFRINAQKNYNATDSLESVLQFTLPNNSFIHDSWLWLNDNTIIKADIIEKNRAISIYEGIVKRRRDPSLLLKTGTNSYQLSVYPMTINYPRKVKITYSVPFNWTYNRATLQLPLNILASSYTLPDVAVNVNYTDTYTKPYFTEKNMNNYVVSHNPYTYHLMINSYSAEDYINLGYNVNMNGKPLLSTYPVNATESVYQLIIPSDAITTNKRNAVFILDHFTNNSIYTLTQVKNFLQATMLNDYNTTDSFNLFYANGNSVVRAFSNWQAMDSLSVINLINSIPNAYTNNSSQYESLLKMAFSFCQTKPGANSQVVLLSNNINYTTSQPAADALFNNVKNYIGNFTNKINIINYTTYNTNTASGYLRGNDILYSKFTLASGGSYFKYQNAAYNYINNKYIYTYDLNPSNCLNELAQSCGSQTNAYSINLGIVNGFAYSRFTSNGVNKLSLNSPYVETGRFTGTMFPGATVQIQAITGSSIINNTYTMTSIEQGTDLHVKAWTHRYIEDLIKANNMAYTTEIIDSSIHNRVLCMYTAFLALETGDTIHTNANENPNVTTGDNVLHIPNPIQFKCYPNPFSESLNLEFDVAITQLDIYDITGRKVFTVTLDKQKKYLWNGKDNNGNALSAGIYIITAQTANERITIKVNKQ